MCMCVCVRVCMVCMRVKRSHQKKYSENKLTPETDCHTPQINYGKQTRVVFLATMLEMIYDIFYAFYEDYIEYKDFIKNISFIKGYIIC